MTLIGPEATGNLDASRPWPGLVPFPEKASSYFYGRTVECDEVFRRIHRDTATLLFGQSGLGKTSLLQAGLFPLLRRSNFLPVLMRLDYTTTVISLAAQMTATLKQALAEAQLAKCTPIREQDRLWAYFHQTDLQLVSARDGAIIPVLVFDQFEEAFTLGLAREGMRGNTQDFLIELADLIEDRPPENLEAQFDSSPGLVEKYIFDRDAYRIIISLREDYLAALESMRDRAPSLGRNRFRLTPMNGRQAQEAVIRPGGDIISPDVAEEIIRFISQARREDPFGATATKGAIETLEVEPSLLSLFCHEINERRLKAGAGRITRELVAGSRQSVLEEFYESALADQPPALRNFVEEELITKSGFRESMALERAREGLRQKGIAPEELDLLVRRRLLRVEERLQVSRIEIIHDLLIDVIRRSRANRAQRHVEATLPDTWLGQSPFRGLEPFRFEDTPIFFGRTEATRNALERLVKNAESGHPFLLILGADGTGKTSLVQAGLVPGLIMTNTVLGIVSWLWVVMRPAEHPEGPSAALAQSIVGAHGLPELAEIHSGVRTLSNMLSDSDDDPAIPIVAALKQRETAARQSGVLPAYGVTRLVIVVDQFEELFTFSGISHQQRMRFMACLQCFVDSGQIFVIAAMRSAFWHRAAELPQLIKLSDGWGRMDLLPPSTAELAEIIRKPAQVAGLSYEVNAQTGIELDAVIASDAAAEPGVLPLLSFVLETLYVEDVTRRGGRILTHETYNIIGGISGAITVRAEETVARLPSVAQAAVPRVLRALISVDAQQLIARAVPIDIFPPGSEQRLVVEAMIEARLLVAADAGTTTTVRPAHDALLTHWVRARDVVAEDLRDLETRTLVEQQVRRWQSESGRNRNLLLLRDPDLANATALARRWGDQLDPTTRDFIAASKRRASRRQRLIAIFAIVFALTTFLSGAATIFAEFQMHQAEKARLRALAALESATVANLRAGSTISPDGRRMLAIDSSGQVRVIDLASGRDVGVISMGDGAVTSVAFSPDGARIATAATTRKVDIWDTSTLSLIVSLKGWEDTIRRVVFSPDGSLIVAGGDDDTARVWSVRSGQQIYLVRVEGPVIAIAFSPDGARLILSTADGGLYLVDSASGSVVRNIIPMR